MDLTGFAEPRERAPSFHDFPAPDELAKEAEFLSMVEGRATGRKSLDPPFGSRMGPRDTVW